MRTPAAPPSSAPPFITAEQIKALAEMTARHAAERTTLACEQQNARSELQRRQEAERLQLGSTPLEAAGNTGLEAGGGNGGAGR
jgi:hypothetical protein